MMMLIAAVIVSPLAGSTFITDSNNSVERENSSSQQNSDFTHTVFAEYGSTTTCPYCPNVGEGLYLSTLTTTESDASLPAK